MSEPIGIDGAGEYARKQLEAAWRDPRLDRERSAAIADFQDAMEEAERVRRLGVLGLHELTHALEREEARLGLKRDADNLSPSERRTLQAAWERAEWARAELANDTPHANAQALVSMTSALDAMVEELGQFTREFQIDALTKSLLAKAAEQVPDAVGEASAEMMAKIERVTRETLTEVLQKAGKLTVAKLKGDGTERYERVLKSVGWGAPDDRPLPADLSTALTELTALRNVLVHRGGRVDEKARKNATTLRYEVGQFVRLSRQDYRTYSAAVRCYGHEIAYRPLRSWPEASDETHGPKLSQWRNYVMVNA